MMSALFSARQRDGTRGSDGLSGNLIYLAAILIWVCPVLFLGILGYQILLTAIWSALIYVTVLKYAKIGNAELAIVGLMPLLFHMLIFGIGGIVAMLVDSNDRFEILRFNFNDDAILYVAFLSLFAGITFWIFYSGSIKSHVSYTINTKNRREWIILVVIMLAIDVYARISLIRSGTYLAWADATVVGDEIYRRTGTLPKVQAALWPMLLSSVVALFFTSVTTLGRNVWRIVSVLLVIAIVGQGSRMMIIMSILIIILVRSAAAHGNANMTYLVEPKKLIMYSIVLGFFLGIVSPVIQEARYMARYDASGGREINTVDYVFEYIPASLTWSRLYGDESARFERGVTLYARIGAYSAYASAIISKMDEGFSSMSAEDFESAVSLLVPKYFIEDRISFDADRAIMRHYAIGNENMDAGSSYVIDIFSYKGMLGVFVLFAFAGYLTGWIVRFVCSKMGYIGLFVSIGLAMRMIPIGNSFAQFVAGVRNNILLLIAMYIIFKTAAYFSTERKMSI